MFRLLPALLFALFASYASAGPNDIDYNWKGIKWHSYADGLKEAKRRNAPIVMVVSANWCSACRTYAKLFHEPSVERAAKKVVMVYVNHDKQSTLSKRHAPDGNYIPRTVVLDRRGQLRPSVHVGYDTDKYFLDTERSRDILELINLAARVR